MFDELTEELLDLTTTVRGSRRRDVRHRRRARLLERDVQLDHPLLHLHDALLVIRTRTALTRVPEHPALAPWCRVADDGDRILVEHGGTVVTFEGRAAAALLPRCCRSSTAPAQSTSSSRRSGRPSRPRSRTPSSCWQRTGCSSTAPIGRRRGSRDRGGIVRRRGHPAHDAGGRARGARAGPSVAVLGTGATPAEIRRQLAADRRRRVEVPPLGAEPEPGSFVVAAPGPDERRRALERLNELALERRAPWLQVLPFDGRVLVVGPLFLPGASACRECFVLRRGACSGYDDDFELVERSHAPRRGAAAADRVRGLASRHCSCFGG